jgi:hypothetical protein
MVQVEVHHASVAVSMIALQPVGARDTAGFGEAVKGATGAGEAAVAVPIASAACFTLASAACQLSIALVRCSLACCLACSPHLQMVGGQAPDAHVVEHQ